MSITDDLAAEHMDFALRVARRTVGRRWWLYDEASSVAMLALTEAIALRERWHADFRDFVSLVVRRRVLQVANRKRSDVWRRCRVLRFCDEPPVEDDASAPEDFERLVRLAPRRCRELLRLVYRDGETIEASAVILGCARSTANARLRVAKRDIRAALG